MSEDSTPRPDGQPGDKPDLIAAGREEARAWKQRRAELNIAPPPPLPEKIGPYKIVRRIGAGGMGVVYEAEQAEPSRRVAVKVVRAPVGADADRVRLFQREIQVLGRLRHPAIAQIYDAGHTEDGQQYFVMELVDGRPLVEFCDLADLSLRDRLALFAEVCKAIQYAHQRGVIHRDLKPANILVDEDGIPHVLDFGLARIVDPEVDATRSLLAGKALIGTLPYMSPEQTREDPGDLDIRTDVYSLGVILYEMLTGTYPYCVAGQIAEVLRNIAESEPKKPSTISRRINDEVETIVLKTLSKERERRYQSAETLAQDVEHYLNGEPIDAKRDSTWYVIRKSLRRYRVAVTVAAAFVLLLGGSAIALLILYQNKTRALEVVEQTSNNLQIVVEFQSSMLEEIDAERMGRGIIVELRDGIRESLDAENATPEDVAAAMASFDASVKRVNPTNLALKVVDENMLARAAETIEEGFADQPLIEAALHQTVGDTYLRLGLYPQAMAEIKRALGIRRRVLGDDDPRTLTSVNNMGFLLWCMGKFAEARSYYREALEGRRRVLGDDHLDTLDSIICMGTAIGSTGNLAEVGSYYREALEGYRRVLGDDDPLTIIIEGRILLLERFAAIQKTLDNTLMPELAASAAINPTKKLQAAAYNTLVRKIAARLLGGETNTADSQGKLEAKLGRLRALWSSGQHDAAQALIREAIAPFVNLPLTNTMLYEPISAFAFERLVAGDFDVAEPLMREVLEGCRRVLGDDHLETLGSLASMGLLLQSMDKLEEAEPYYREALESYRRVLGDDDPRALSANLFMGLLLQSMGKGAEAGPYLREGLEAFSRLLGDDHSITLWLKDKLAWLLWECGRYTEAEPIAREAVDGYRRTIKTPNIRLLSAIHTLACAVRDAGRPGEALPLFEEIDSARFDPVVRRAPQLVPEILLSHAECLMKLEHYAEVKKKLVQLHASLDQLHAWLDGSDAKEKLYSRLVERLINLYATWHEADPNAGHGAQAAEWRAKLPMPTTEPAVEP